MERIIRNKVSDQVIEQILHSIRKGELKVGDKLPPEIDLTKQLSVGRSSLREALRALSLVGIVNVQQGKGAYLVADPESLALYSLKWKDISKQQKVQEVVEARMHLEQVIVQLVIEKAGEDDFRELRDKLEHMQSLRNEREAFIQADLAFHLALAKASHNSIIIGLYHNIRHIMRTWLERTMPRIDKQDRFITEQQHSDLLAAIEARDLAKAQTVIRRHIMQKL